MSATLFRPPNLTLFRHRAVVLLAWSVGLLAMGGPGRADDILPKAPPASKYAKMAGHSPFAPPTAPVGTQAPPPKPPAPGWADGLTATMIAQDGPNYMVTVVDAQNSQQHLYLTAEPDPETKMAVVSVKWGATRDDPPTITLSKGKEFAQVRYEASSSGTSSPLGGGVPIPGAGRNPPVGIPGGQAFHSPLQVPPAQPTNQGPSSNVVRRPLIRSQPPAAPTSVRPGVNPPANGVRPNPAVPVDDDDDD